MTEARSFAPLVVLTDGSVVVAGGLNAKGQPLDSSKRFDEARGSWVLTPPMNAPLWGHTATLMADGNVLVIGGFVNGSVTASAEIYRR
jgi:hypothetical protein